MYIILKYIYIITHSSYTYVIEKQKSNILLTNQQNMKIVMYRKITERYYKLYEKKFL